MLCLVLAIVLGLVTPVEARKEFTLPADLADPTVFPGIWGTRDHEGSPGKLELRGDWVHSCGNVLMNVTNFGVLGSMPGTRFPFADAASFQWPNGSGVEYLWAAGLWVGAIKNGVPHVSTGLFDYFEFRPGRTELDRMYVARRGDLGGLRIPPFWDDDGDGVPNEDWLDGRDNDGDGRIDEDYATISDQMFSCEYNDSDPGIRRLLPDHVPLDILVQQSSYCWGSSTREDFIVLDFRIINQGIDPLSDMHVGFFADFDIGRRGESGVSRDDLAGFWEGTRTVRRGERTQRVPVSIGYMLDADGDRGEAPGHVGLTFLAATGPLLECGERRRPGMRNFRTFSGNAPYDLGGEPRNDEQRFEVLAGTAPRSLTPPPLFPFGGRDRQSHLTLRQDDYRIAVSAGSFGVIAPGDTFTFQAALVAGASFEDMLENAVQANLSLQGQWHDCDGDPETGVDGFETHICGTPDFVGCEFSRDPCDGSCDEVVGVDPRCNLRVRADSCYWFNNDCAEERSSGIRTGVDGKECNLPWFVDLPPPPPSMRIITKENRVDILWDDRSETTVDEVLGLVDFESYRVWRADNWTRPLGTSARTGPSSELWALLAEFDQTGNGIGAERGLESIRYDPNIPPGALEFYREWNRAHPDRDPPGFPGLTRAQQDTAFALARGVRYHRYVDPPFIPRGLTGGPCPRDGCPEFETRDGPVNARCNRAGICQETAPPPKSGAPYFYSVTATDHTLQPGPDGDLVAVGRGLAGNPATNFTLVHPTTDALPPERYGQAAREIRVVPNPATKESMAAWRLNPNDEDPSGNKIEFHHLPRSRGTVTIFTLAGDRVHELVFDGSEGNGSLAWDLVSRNRQEVTSGVYLYVVVAEDPAFDRFVGRFVVVR